MCLLTVLVAVPAKAEPTNIQPYGTVSFSVILSKYSSTQVEIDLKAIFGNSGESCTLNAVLQRKVNGSWTTYDTYSGSGSGYYVRLLKRPAPPKGYTYRVKGTLNSTTFTNIVQYSNELSW